MQLSLSSSATSTFSASSDFTELMLSKLVKNDVDGGAVTVRELLSQMFPYARQYLLEHGIKEEEIRLTPCIHLQLTT